MKHDVVFFSQELLPASNAAAVRGDFLIRSLEAEGIVVTPITYNQVAKGLRLRIRPHNKMGLIRRLIWEIASGFELFFVAMRTTSQKPKALIVLSSPPFLTVLTSAFMLAVSGRAYALDVRDIYPEVYAQEGLLSAGGLPYQILSLLVGWVYKRAEFVTTVTNGLYEKIKINEPKTNLHLVMNGFDSEHFTFVDRSQRTGPFKVLFHGTLGRMQDLDSLKKIAHAVLNKNASIEFIVAGDGPLRHTLESAVPANLRLEPAFEYQDAPKILAQCDLGISLRKAGFIGQSSLPVKIFEYIGSGMPVLSAPESEAGPILNKNQFGIEFKDTNIEKLADTIVQLSSRGADYQAMRSALKRNRIEYSRQKSAGIFTKAVKEFFGRSNH